MTERFEPTNADQHALIVWLAKNFGERRELGKTAVQKLIHILDEGFGVSTGYSFMLYTYGPFSRDLAGDLDVVRALKGVVIEYVSDENKYLISAGETNERILARASEYLTCLSPDLIELKASFFDKKPRYLELFSTLLFLRMRKPSSSSAELVRQLRAIKPKYDEQETLSAWDDLSDFLKQRSAKLPRRPARSA
jgi:uncharacterized protein YwgA